MIFVLAGNNAKKLREMNDILSSIGVEVRSGREMGFEVHTEETGTTFLENARLKAADMARASNMPAIADDSGLVVDALGGEPGVYSARYGGDACADDGERMLFLLKNMEGMEQRSAHFVSCIVCIMPDGSEISAEGRISGEIAHAPSGEGGFGYDPVFYVPELGKTLAEIPQEEKNKISHRARALEKLKLELEKCGYAHN